MRKQVLNDQKREEITKRSLKKRPGCMELQPMTIESYLVPITIVYEAFRDWSTSGNIRLHLENPS